MGEAIASLGIALRRKCGLLVRSYRFRQLGLAKKVGYNCHTRHTSLTVMLTVRLDPETEQQLAEILAHETDVNRSELVKRLIRERWLALNLDITFVERRGGHPQHLLQNAPPDLSERTTRKQAIADYLKQRHP
jgi:hypothetical protein